MSDITPMVSELLHKLLPRSGAELIHAATKGNSLELIARARLGVLVGQRTRIADIDRQLAAGNSPRRVAGLVAEDFYESVVSDSWRQRPVRPEPTDLGDVMWIDGE